jgi:hypothetical protein
VLHAATQDQVLRLSFASSLVAYQEDAFETDVSGPMSGSVSQSCSVLQVPRRFPAPAEVRW